MALDEILYYIYEDQSSTPRYLTRSGDRVELKPKGTTPEEQLLQQWVVIEAQGDDSEEAYEIHHSDVGKDPKAVMKTFYELQKPPFQDGVRVASYSLQLRRVREDEPKDPSYETRWIISHGDGDNYNIFAFDNRDLRQVLALDDSPMVASYAAVRHSWHFTPVNP
ncbi:hypothetical protein D9756_011080 [Leucocoprinus leucothites]|uniref:Uncharacterized protein n=1 Tax=Leucocoprinus leucothites TaxID=201217 RepID=A0A8H5FPY5_9AGAR|nr:hypothetical protein D9756_011080 [Leucoagaricus leucothites]